MRNKLTMKVGDVRVAIANAFRQDFKEIQFTRGEHFDGISADCGICFTIQGEFHGEGCYFVIGDAKLITDGLHQLYKISGNVIITCVDKSPVATFKESLTAIKK